jgi:hypothetical protein
MRTPLHSAPGAGAPAPGTGGADAQEAVGDLAHGHRRAAVEPDPARQRAGGLDQVVGAAVALDELFEGLADGPGEGRLLALEDQAEEALHPLLAADEVGADVVQPARVAVDLVGHDVEEVVVKREGDVAVLLEELAQIGDADAPHLGGLGRDRGGVARDAGHRAELADGRQGAEAEPGLAVARCAGLAEDDLAAGEEEQVLRLAASLEEHRACGQVDALAGEDQLGEVLVGDAVKERDGVKIGRSDRHGDVPPRRTGYAPTPRGMGTPSDVPVKAERALSVKSPHTASAFGCRPRAAT